MDLAPGPASHAPSEAREASATDQGVHQVAAIDGYGDPDHNDPDAVPAEPPTPPAMAAVAAVTAAGTDEPAEGE